MVSLIACIPLELARETIVNLLVNFALSFPSTATVEKYFQFSNCYYQQVKRAPMGSPISGGVILMLFLAELTHIAAVMRL